MATEANSRDARRRRRILEQGSDRLAFIAGRIQNPPPPPLPDSASSSLPRHFDSNTTPPPTVEDSDSNLHNHQSDLSDASNRIIQTPSLHRHEEAESEISSSQVESESEPERQQIQPAPPPPPEVEESKPFIIPSDIISAINASKVTRLCCSVVIAVLVIASYLGFSLLGSKLVKTVIGFRPLYLVLVTNLTVVAARLVSGKQRGSERRRRFNTASSSSDGDKCDSQLARTLELGLLVLNVVDAVFMDCAVYAVVLVCGLSFLHT